MGINLQGRAQANPEPQLSFTRPDKQETSKILRADGIRLATRGTSKLPERGHQPRYVSATPNKWFPGPYDQMSPCCSGSPVGHFPLVLAANRAHEKDGHRQLQGAGPGPRTPNFRMAGGSKEEKIVSTPGLAQPCPGSLGQMSEPCPTFCCHLPQPRRLGTESIFEGPLVLDRGTTLALWAQASLVDFHFF